MGKELERKIPCFRAVRQAQESPVQGTKVPRGRNQEEGWGEQARGAKPRSRWAWRGSSRYQHSATSRRPRESEAALSRQTWPFQQPKLWHLPKPSPPLLAEPWMSREAKIWGACQPQKQQCQGRKAGGRARGEQAEPAGGRWGGRRAGGPDRAGLPGPGEDLGLDCWYDGDRRKVDKELPLETGPYSSIFTTVL